MAKEDGNNNVQFPIEVIILLFGIAGAFILTSAHAINAGTVGVVTQFGGVTGTVLSPGLQLTLPWPIQGVTIMPTALQKFSTEAERAQSKDLQNTTTSFAINYHIDKANSAWIYQNVGDVPTLEQNVLAPTIMEDVKATVAKYSAEQLVDNRTKVMNEIATTLTSAVSKYNVSIDQVSMTNFQFDPTFQNSVEQKVIAYQNYLRNLTVLNTTKVIANQTVAIAQGNATAAIVRARGQAEAALINANATAQAAYIIDMATANNTNYLTWYGLNRWNGVTPATVVGSSPMMPALVLNSNTVK